MVGSRIFNAFYPDRYYNYDAEDDANLVTPGHTRHKRTASASTAARSSPIS
ncbi:MAG: hypothetical protein IPJ30_23990 [Acidobacteria bacterium]|nr:hypothetical protein [Acidobacteriota bacterium]